MVDCITRPQARITVAPAGDDVALILTATVPAACTLSTSPTKELAGDLLSLAGMSCDLVTIRPGPVLHLWCDGIEIACLPLSPPAAMSLVADLAQAIVRAQR